MAEQTQSETPRVHEIRKYPNRRYYDTTSRRHLTLEEVHTLIIEGTEVRVTDSKSGEDITAAVLTQIILKLETPKLQVFPVELLHQVIRTNGRLVKDFVEGYLQGALTSFIQAQGRVGSQIREGLGLSAGAPRSFAEWTRMAMGPFSPYAWMDRGAAAGDGPGGPAEGDGRASQEGGRESATDGDLRRELEVLKEQVKALREERRRSDRHERDEGGGGIGEPRPDTSG